MTVKQLKKELEKYPDNMDILIPSINTEFEFTLLNSIMKQTIKFSEVGTKVNAPAECIILNEE